MPQTGLHILHVIDSLAVGGAERMLVDIANATVAPYRVSVCITRSDAPLAHDLHPEIPLHVIGRTSRFDVGGMLRFARLVRAQKVDVLHAHGLSTLSFLVMLRTLGLIRTPVVLHEHFGNIERETNTPTWYRLWGWRFVDQFVGVYQKLADLAADVGIPAGKINVIENALDLDRLRRADPIDLHQAFNIPTNALIGIVVAGMRFEKGIDLLLDALTLIASATPYHLLIVGSERQQGYANACHQQVTALGLADRVTFAGERTDVPGLVRGADFAIMPSRSESGPLVLIEYGCFGLPIVATQVGSIGNRFANLGAEGFVPPNDTAALAAALSELLELNAARSRKSGAASAADHRSPLQHQADDATLVRSLSESGAPMKLLIISNMAHYYEGKRVFGWGPTVQELNNLATLFDEVKHIGCLYQTPTPPSALPYEVDNLTLIPLPPSGGEGLRAKLQILTNIPLYVMTILRHLPDADVVHVRCPANIPLLAVILLAFARNPKLRWIKYAGNWKPTGREALSYTFQRWWLEQNIARAKVTVNGHWVDQPAHIFTFYNPSLTDEDFHEAQVIAAARTLTAPIRALFVGRVETAKGVGRALQVLSTLYKQGIPIYFDVVGDGAERPAFEALAQQLGIETLVTFHGWLPKTDLAQLYTQAHFMLFPTNSSEGWPKVISEGMAYGVVPLAGNVSSIPQYLEQFAVGKALDPLDTTAFVSAISNYLDQPELWRAESRRGAQVAEQFTYRTYLKCVKELLELTDGME